MNRIKNIDYLRACAIIYIILYHCYVLSGEPWQAHFLIHEILHMGGEVGVTLFFLLSGYGIYMSLYAQEKRGETIKWLAFMKKRCKRILPQYYVCISVLIIFMSAQLIGRDGIAHIIAYFTFTENLFVETHGSINGALWTMGAIMQFYLIAPFLYRGVRKKPVFSAIFSIVFTIVARIAAVHVIDALGTASGSTYFVYERQLFSALDNFVLGMVAAFLVERLVNGNGMMGKRKLQTGIVLSLAGIILLIAWILFYSKDGTYGDDLVRYPAHSILAVVLMVIVLGFSLLPEMKARILKPVSFIAKNEYGIYLWHMPVIRMLMSNSPWFHTMSQKYFWMFAPAMIVITAVVGYFATYYIDRPRTSRKA